MFRGEGFYTHRPKGNIPHNICLLVAVLHDLILEWHCEDMREEQ